MKPLKTHHKAILWQTIIDIENNPESWEQDNWCTPTHCGTAYCYGGHVAVRLGYKLQPIDKQLNHREPNNNHEIVYFALSYSLDIPRELFDEITNADNSLEEIKAIVLLLCHDVYSFPEGENDPRYSLTVNAFKRIGPEDWYYKTEKKLAQDVIDHLKEPPQEVLNYLKDEISSFYNE